MKNAPNSPRARQQGFTLIELMISMVIASLLIGLILSIYTRMTVAYRTQTTVTQLQQSLRAGRNLIASQVRAAGNRLTTFRVATGALGSTTETRLLPLQIENNFANMGADLIRIYYVDTRVSSAVVAGDITTPDVVTVADLTPFKLGDIVALVATTKDLGTVRNEACVLRITKMDPATQEVGFSAGGGGAPYNAAGNPHCLDIIGTIAAAVADDLTDNQREVMLALFVGRSYRLDPTDARNEHGILQESPSGELEGQVVRDWIDLGVGFTDLQFAVQYREPVPPDELAAAVDADGDGDPTRDWYSGDNMAEPDPFGERPPVLDPASGPPPTTFTADAFVNQVSIGLAIRTYDETSGVTSQRTPGLMEWDAGPADYNRIGNSPSRDLSDQSNLPARMQGDHIFRGSVVTVQVRNMGMIN